MNDNRVVKALAALQARGEAAFMPFAVLGDPDLERSITICEAFCDAGADIIELGFPFSDPPADGPVIQASDQRALANGVTPDDCFAAIAELKRRRDPPVALLVYFNLVLQRGIDRFYADAAAAGVDAILVADVPLEHSGALVTAGRAHGVAPVFIATHLSTEARLRRIAEVADGYIYVAARLGITGEQDVVDSRLAGTVARVKATTGLPALAGFGIASPDHVRQVLAAGADGAICGSAFVRRIEAHALGEISLDALLAELRELCGAMKQATRPASARGRTFTHPTP